ncbi:MAG: DNA polymerase III subunit delta [Schleiferiaceae bacterium]
MQAVVNKVVAKWRQGEFSPVYVVAGEEPFFVHVLTDALLELALPEADHAFNQSVLYGRDVDARSVESEAKRYPMMAERTVVVVREAQDLRNLEDLATYVKNPQPQTVLLLSLTGKALDKRKALYKALKPGENYFQFDRIPEYQITGTVAELARHRNLKISEKAAAVLVESLGVDLSAIDQELGKYAVVLGEGGEVTAATVEKYTGANREYNQFELLRALVAHDVERSYKIARSMMQHSRSSPLILVIATLYGTFFKALIYQGMGAQPNPKTAAAQLGVSEFALRDISRAAQNYSGGHLARIVGYLREADRQAKGMASPNLRDSDILDELLFKILY